MTRLRLALIVFLLLTGSATLTAQNAAKPVWTTVLDRPFLKDRGGFAGTSEQNQSSGIARWDDSHVLIYWLSASKNLVVRKSGEKPEGAWNFSVQIVRTDNGQVDRSVLIPAGSENSELVVIAGGIAETDHNGLTFYSHNFKRLDPPFVFSPLHEPVTLFQETVFRDPQRLYVTNDQKTFLLIDSNGRRSHVFVFSGTGLTLRSDWLLEDVDWHHISIGDEGVLYRGFETPNHAYWTRFDGHTWEWNVALPVERRCVSPVYIDKDRVLNVCGSLTILNRDNSTLIYKEAKKERVQPPAVISPDKQLAAVFKYTFKDGGIWDTTEYRTGVDLLIVRLDGDHKACDIPVMPMPRSQLTFNFAGDSTLIVLNDDHVSAYKQVCL
jgi:hypothetical protein